MLLYVHIIATSTSDDDCIVCICIYIYIGIDFMRCQLVHLIELHTARQNDTGNALTDIPLDLRPDFSLFMTSESNSSSKNQFRFGNFDEYILSLLKEFAITKTYL